MSGAEKEKKSRWRLSGFHSKNKDKDDHKEKDTIRKESSANTFDSAYASSEPSSSANPSFTSNPRPISGEQWVPLQRHLTSQANSRECHNMKVKTTLKD